ncbi:hypothetical protein Taro_000960 [Colocasia esculenta]|uniref:Uncharacterized protein n=1 Tax=Colocasia esculenta TaxID=4460 RepID=A0A843TGG4_COLES|nr:hypothetical protein [Colocasia esculenta]
MGPEYAAYRVVVFSGSAPESEREKDSTLDCNPGLELEEHKLKLGLAFPPRVPLLLGLLSSSSKPQQRVRPMLGLVWIRGSTEPRWVQTPKVTMQLAYTVTVSTSLVTPTNIRAIL